MTSRARLLLLFSVAFVALVAPTSAHAFCGFYISGVDASLFNSATQVVLMRDGQRTVLSMQNNYQGPLADFALVIPVPVVLMEDNVKTIDETIFAQVDQLTAPRLVEYWELNPCPPEHPTDPPGWQDAGIDSSADGGVTNNGSVAVEAQFKVGEYDIVILSAQEGAGLESWLQGHGYNIPEGSAPHLNPYIQGGSYFFVAKVDTTKVRFEDGRAVLSPLRFWYDSPRFDLPIRLGLINAQDVQDLIIYILALDQRYEVANYPNVFIPTNINVVDEVRTRFGDFYSALYEETLRQNPGAVVTEYSWSASSCDPCPGPTLEEQDYLTLGADATNRTNRHDWTITRLHARYAPGAVGEDLVFRTADPVAGGREFVQANGELEEGAVPYYTNNFQGRYAIRHRWTGPVNCENPVYNRWGGQSGQQGQASVGGSANSPNTDGGAVNRGEGVVLSALVAEDVPELGIDSGVSGNNGGANNGAGNNGPVNNGAGNNGAGNNGPANNGAANNGPANNGGAPAANGDSSVSGGGCSTAADTASPATWPLLGLVIGLGLMAVAMRRR